MVCVEYFKETKLLDERYSVLRLYDVNACICIVCRQINIMSFMWHCAGFSHISMQRKIRDLSMPELRIFNFALGITANVWMGCNCLSKYPPKIFGRLVHNLQLKLWYSGKRCVCICLSICKTKRLYANAANVTIPTMCVLVFHNTQLPASSHIQTNNMKSFM